MSDILFQCNALAPIASNVIQAGMGVPDATGFGDDIADLEKAGSTVETGFGAFNVRGLHMRFRNLGNPPAWGMLLLNSFRAIGLEVTVAADSGVAEDGVTLLIGGKP